MLVFSTWCLQVKWKNTVATTKWKLQTTNTAQYGYSTWQYEYKVSMDSWRLRHWSELPLQCTVRTTVHDMVEKWGAVVSYQHLLWVGVFTATPQTSVILQEIKPIKRWLQQDRGVNVSVPSHPADICLFCSFELSWIFSMWQREVTYLLHLVRPYRVQGGERDRTEEGGKWSCGTVGSGTVQCWQAERERGEGGGSAALWTHIHQRRTALRLLQRPPRR